MSIKDNELAPAISEHLYITEDDLAHYNPRRPAEARGMVCHAPFKSIFFNVRGRMNVCCFNKHYVLGTYPEQSLEEMWFGGKANFIREAIKKNDLSYGCSGCYNIIKAGNFSSLPAKNFDTYPLDPSGYPTKIDFELSNLCNLECIMCRGDLSSSIRKNRDKLPPLHIPYDDKFVEQLEPFIPHIKNSHFLGGEPFLVPVYYKIWEKISQTNTGAHLTIQTNATIMNNKVKGILEKIPFGISVSIDALKQESYERIRLNAKLDNVIENIRFFRAYCTSEGTNMNIAFCPMPQNWKEIPDIVEFSNQLHVELFFTTVVDPPHCSLRYMPSHELSGVINYLKGYEFPEENSVQVFNKRNYIELISQLSYWQQEAVEREEVMKQPSPINSMEEFYHKLSEYLTKKHPATKEQLFSALKERIDYVIQEAEKSGHLEQALHKVYHADFTVITQDLPVFSKEKVFDMFKEDVE